ncbi:MAG: hypothetical protein PUG67_01370 [Peptoniphilaceae bacterium]|nr:hypothetical protein [Peptoniphilaceae bacterium]MDY6019343.1 hypothetical protein [Anaerococcus sp.]
MRNTATKFKRNEKIYSTKLIISSLIRLLAGLGVLAFGIYFKEIFEIGGGIFLLFFSLIQFQGRKRRKKSNLLVKKEREKLKFLCLVIIVFSLINPIGILPAIYDLFKRDWLIRGGLDE